MAFVFRAVLGRKLVLLGTALAPTGMRLAVSILVLRTKRVAAVKLAGMVFAEVREAVPRIITVPPATLVRGAIPPAAPLFPAADAPFHTTFVLPAVAARARYDLVTKRRLATRTICGKLWN